MQSSELIQDLSELPDASALPAEPASSGSLPENGRADVQGQAGQGPGSRLGGLWARRGLWLGLSAIGTSYILTLLLARSEPVLTIAWSGLIVAGVLAILAWGQTPWLRAFAKRTSWWPLENLDFERALRLAGIALAVVLIWLANRQFVAHMNEVFGLAGALWLGSMALLITSTAGWPQAGEGIPWPCLRRRASRSIPLKEVTPNGALAVPSHEDVAASQPYGGDQPAWSRWEIALFVGIVALAVIVRVWDLADVPFAIHPDEIITGRVASQAYINPSSTSIFQTLWQDINLPALWFFLVAQALKIGGSTLAVLRLPAALFGAAAVVPLYFLLRSVWGRATAIAGASIMAFSVASVDFGRVTLNNVVTPFFWASCFFFLLRALRRGRPVDWVLAGIFGGLGEYFYYGTRLLWAILIVFAIYLLVVHWRRARYLLPSFGLAAAGYMAAFGPLFGWFLLHPGLYFGRGLTYARWNHFPTSLADLGAMLDALRQPFVRNLLTVSTLPATDPIYFSSMLMPLEAALLVLGVALLIWRWRHPAAFLVLLSGFGVLLVGGTILPEAGNLNHWTPAFPSIYAAVAVPVSGLAWASGRFLSTRYRKLAAGLLGLCLALLGLYDLNYYFTQYHTYRPEFDIPAAKARFQAQLGTGYQVRSVGRTWQLYDPEFTGYLVKNMDGKQLWNPAAELPLPYTPGKGQVFTFFGDQLPYINPIKLMYPGGTRGQMDSQGGSPLFDYYIVPPDIADLDYGALVQLYSAGAQKPVRVEHVPQVGSLPADVTYPVRTRWTALMYVPYDGPVGLSVAGANATILLDGQDYSALPGRLLQPGWHQVTVEATLRGPAQVKLMLSEAGEDPVEVPHERLWAVSPGSGLLGAVAPGDPAQAPLVRTEQYIGFTDLATEGSFGPQSISGLPVKARWVGQMHTTIPGMYRLEVRTNGVSRLLLDGKKALATCGSHDLASVIAEGQLNPGWHPIQLDYMGGGTANTLELYWTTPDGARSLVPPTALRFAPDTADGPTQAPTPPETVDCQEP